MQCFISAVLINRSVLKRTVLKRVLLIFIAWLILEKVNVILDLVTINWIVGDIVNKIIRFVFPFT